MMKPYGLVVAGGKSTRMGRDKAFISYHGKPQVYYIYDLLRDVCEKVYISCNKDQSALISSDYNILTDNNKYSDIGPMAALLTAFDTHPQRSFIAIGCDYPSVNHDHIRRLYGILQAGNTVAFYNKSTNIYEPLLAGYHHTISIQLNNQFTLKNYSLRYLLEHLNAAKIEWNTTDIPKSIDTPEAAEDIISHLKISS